MIRLSGLKMGLGLLLAGLACLSASAQILDVIGVTLLNTVTNDLNGSGVRVAQVEADYGSSGAFEVNPSEPIQPAGLFEYYGGSTPLFANTATAFPNSVGTESSHADYVAQYFYGLFSTGVLLYGVSTNVAHVDNYEASAFVEASELGGNYTVTLPSHNINDVVVNQSFVFTNITALQKAADSAYDNYAVEYSTLFVSGVGDSGPVSAPATCYNGLGVGAIDGQTSYGPTLDNGRAKPDLVAPAQNTSLATPLVAGAAAVLIQAGLHGAGGADTNSAVSLCTLKALLLNGAVKPAGWMNPSPSPLDTNYGAGILNVFNSYKQLTGGKHGYSVAGTVATGAAHPPGAAGTAVSVLSGWDCNTNTSSTGSDGVNHYYFNVTNVADAATFTATVTLAWNRHQNATAINNLKLYLYNAVNNNLVASSISTVDNVQHIWLPKLPAGRYDLQVWKAGGSSEVSTTEPYALAFEFYSVPLSIAQTGANITLSWPLYPAGFLLASTTNLLTSPVSWNTNYPVPVVNVSQNLNQLTLGLTNATEFFQLTLP